MEGKIPREQQPSLRFLFFFPNLCRARFEPIWNQQQRYISAICIYQGTKRQEKVFHQIQFLFPLLFFSWTTKKLFILGGIGVECGEERWMQQMKLVSGSEMLWYISRNSTRNISLVKFDFFWMIYLNLDKLFGKLVSFMFFRFDDNCNI